MKRDQLDPKRPRQMTRSDLARIDRMTDAEIDYSDMPPLGDEFFTKATVAWPLSKQQLTIRLDADVLKWLKSGGRDIRRASNVFCGRLWRVSRRAGRDPNPGQRRAPAHAADSSQSKARVGRKSGFASWGLVVNCVS